MSSSDPKVLSDAGDSEATASDTSEIMLALDVAEAGDQTQSEDSGALEAAPISVEELQHLAGDADIKV